MAEVITFILITALVSLIFAYPLSLPLRKVIKHHGYKNASPMLWTFFFSVFGILLGLIYYMAFEEGTDLENIRDIAEDETKE